MLKQKLFTHVIACILIISLIVPVLSAKSEVVELNEGNWDLMLKNEWMVEFYAPWCPACKNLAPIWNEFGTWSKDLGIKTARVDVTTSPALSGRFIVTALPTIFHVLNGEFRQYKGSRELNSFMTFIEEKKWQSVEVVPAWKNPNSIQMSIVSLFFKLSHYLKEVNTQLLKEYGLPVWGTYALFAVATVLMGGIVGLFCVFIIDCICPPKSAHRQSFAETEKKPLKAKEILKIDELKDEEEETSEGEKNSGSDEEEEESVGDKKSAPSSPEGNRKAKGDVMKRKTRKAD